jgi:cytochrome c oxidase subunit 1
VTTVAERAGPRPAPHGGAVGWLTTTNHKQVGILYMVTTFGFFVVAGILSLVMRAELSAPGLQLVDAERYNELFTIHGTAMIFLFVAPFGIGLANYLLPLQVGAPDMALPRMNALSYWLFLAGGLLVFSGFATATGAADAGWTSYVPLAETRTTPGPGLDLWIVGLLLTSASSIMGAINFLSTAILLRAPGMTMWRLPLFTWTVLVNSLLILVSFPPLATAFTMLFVDRRLGGVFFDPAAGGSPVLYQHLFWFLGHPEVYIMILPFFGVISEVVPVFSRKPLFGYVGLVLATLAIAGLSMGVWAHHMFTTGAVSNPFFSGVSFLIAVPTGIKFFNWIGTMWRGKLTFPTPMLFAIGFLLNFLLGGITGVIVASPPIDFHVQDTHFVVAHFHYTIMGGSVFAIFAAIHFWWPKITGYRLSEGLGRVTFWLMFAGFNLTFFPLHLLGLQGMPRRVADYLPSDGWTGLNVLATVGSAMVALSVLVFLANMVLARRRRESAGDDPWGANSLEWTTSSPPPEHNFERIPEIRSERPAFDFRHPEFAGTDGR